MWKYLGNDIKSMEDIPKENAAALGFIYMITQLSTGKKYIGKKMLSKAATKTVKGVKKKIRKESDWLEYWSSSPQINQWIADAGGTKDFTKEILIFCNSKGGLAYSEELALYMVGAMENDKWLNQNIRSKIYRSWVNKDLGGIATLRKTLKPLM